MYEFVFQVCQIKLAQRAMHENLENMNGNCILIFKAGYQNLRATLGKLDILKIYISRITNSPNTA